MVFYEKWAKPELPSIREIKTAKIEQPVLPLVFFSNPKKDTDGKINLTCDYVFVQPDGNEGDNVPNTICGAGALTAPQYNLQLSSSPIGWCADAGDPVGEWTVKVIITDHNRKLTIPLSTKINITE